VLDKLLLHHREMGARRFLRRLWIALADRRGDLAVRGRIACLVVDAMCGLAPVPPRAVGCDMQHRLEDRDEERVARRERNGEVERWIKAIEARPAFAVATGARPSTLASAA
jgi:hypothetical protein